MPAERPPPPPPAVPAHPHGDPAGTVGTAGAAPSAAAVASAAAAVRAALVGPAASWPLHVVASTASTNSDLLAPACHPETPACVLWALTQQAGRGRGGRRWLAGDGSLSFSLRLPMARAGSGLLGLPLAVAVAVTLGLEDLGVSGLAIKWPNDLLRRGRKLGGILVEVSGSSPVIGIGLNVRLDPLIAAQLDQPAADLQPQAGPPLSRELVLAALLNRLAPALALFEAQGFAAFRSDWTARAAWLGQPVQLGSEIHGILLGVDASGALRIQTALGEQRGLVGDLSLRQVDAAGAPPGTSAPDTALAVPGPTDGAGASPVGKR